MSWLIDTKAISSLLKEAQKQFDKALDIKDDEEEESDNVQTSTDSVSPISSSKVTPSASSSAGGWGLNFSNDPKKSEPITKVPCKGSSESLEVLSNPTTPSSELQSPQSVSTVYESDSVEVLSADDTSKGISQIDSIASPTSPESIEVLGDLRYDDLTSISVADVSITDEPSQTTEVPVTVKLPITTPPSRLRLNVLPSHMPITYLGEPIVEEDKALSSKMNESNDSDKTIVSVDETSMEMIEVRTVSDSTASFEEICPSIRPTPPPGNVQKLMDETQRKGSSGDQSADELETGTSSDIEIISSPSTNNSAYRESPIKTTGSKEGGQQHRKGHIREPSEVSVQSNASEESRGSSQSETEKLSKRINELSEILEQRELKLLEIGRRNSELHEQNLDLQSKIEAKERAKDPLEITNVTEEYAQRMSALEKKFQQTIREKEAFRKELAALKQEFVSKINKSEADKSLEEKEKLVTELRQEGEKLSKQILNYTNIIKKLRAKEKENDTSLKSQKEQITSLTEETERLKKSLQAKSEVECQQIEAVHKLTSEKKMFEEEAISLQIINDDLQQKHDTLKTSLEAAKTELKELRNQNAEMSKRLADLSSIETENQETITQNQHMNEVITELKKKHRQKEEQQEAKINQLRKENANLLRQLEDAEHRLQNSTEEYSYATVPLIKQIDSLRSQMATKTENWEKREQELLQKVEEFQQQARQTNMSETTFKEKICALKEQVQALETKLNESYQKMDELTVKLQSQKLEFEREANARNDTEIHFKTRERELKEKITQLQNKLTEAEERLKRQPVTHRNVLLLNEANEEDDERTYTNEPKKSVTLGDGCDKNMSLSPTVSLDRMSLGDSFSWHPVSIISSTLTIQ